MTDRPFVTRDSLSGIDWRAFERATQRLLMHRGFEGVRLIGASGDRGADLIAHMEGRRWAIQVKHWSSRVGSDVVDRTIEAARTYEADIPAIVSLSGFTPAVRDRQGSLHRAGIPLQLWDREDFVRQADALGNTYLGGASEVPFRSWDYQEPAITSLTGQILSSGDNKAMIVMATGLGKTSVAAEAIRRARATRPFRLLALAHTNALVYQLERSFWTFLRATESTCVWNGYERPDEEALAACGNVFASVDSVYESIERGTELPAFDVVLVDEAHHAGAKMYSTVLETLRAGREGGPFLVGLTATPWRPDEKNLEGIFGPPLVTVDLVTGMKNGYLANVDYRIYTDNIDWEAFPTLEGESFSPRQINRTLFIKEWDDGVVTELQNVWREQTSPRAIVFCGTIDHAIRMRDRINSLRFCHAEAIYSGSRGDPGMSPYERNLVLSKFHDGQIDIVCAVDIFNEGVDVPDVNVIVFQRVTHSRRIFIQQLGRGLRIAEGKESVIVLDFVSDIRRFAAGLDLKNQLHSSAGPKIVSLPHKVEFRKVGGSDPETESFLRQWLEDVAEVEDSGEDASVLKYPPALPGSKR